jgi:mono/diheme cytochrome c family protein
MKTFQIFPLLGLGLLPSIASADSAETYSQVCAVCHGAGGAGDGAAAAGLPVTPANFTEPAFWESLTEELVFKRLDVHS